MKKDGTPLSDQIHHRNAFLMNTTLDIILWGIDQTTADKISEAMITEIKELEQILGRYDKNTETYRLNKTAWQIETVISPVMMQVIRRCLVDLTLTEGYFNVFAGNNYSALKSKNTSQIPTYRVLPEKPIEINEASHSLKFFNEHVSLDFGGIGKGIALDAVAKILDSFEISNTFISFGGSSVLTRGHHPHGEFWPFSFRNQGIEKVWHLNNDAISVSNAIRDVNGPQHILNPLDANSIPQKKTAYVQSNSATDAEVLSTALIAAPQQLHTKIAGNYNVKNWSLFNI